MQPHEFLRRQFRLYRLWILQNRVQECVGEIAPPLPDGVSLHFLERSDRRDWICQRTSDSDWEQYRTAITNEHDLVLAQRGETTLGWAWLGYDKVHLAPLGRRILLPRHSAYLYDCWVRPEERGKGLGRALVAARLERARQRDVKTLLTHVVEGNDASRAALEGNGFSVVGRTAFLQLSLLRMWVNAPFHGFRQPSVVPQGISS